MLTARVDLSFHNNSGHVSHETRWKQFRALAPRASIRRVPFGEPHPGEVEVAMFSLTIQDIVTVVDEENRPVADLPRHRSAARTFFTKPRTPSSLTSASAREPHLIEVSRRPDLLRDGDGLVWYKPGDAVEVGLAAPVSQLLATLSAGGIMNPRS